MTPNGSRIFLALVFAGLTSVAVAADTFPQKPLRAIVPFPPGGAADTIMRIIAQGLSDSLGQQVVVDNRPGGGTIIATSLAAKAVPDGHTLLVVSAAFTVNPSLYRKLPYDTEKDFMPITQTYGAPNLLVINPSIPVSSVKELIDYAKANPHKLNFGSAGNGTSTHLAGEMLRTMAHIDIVHVPYKGDAPAVSDLIGGQIQLLFISLAPVAQHVKTGRLKALAVSSTAPFSLLPDLPTIADSGVPGFSSTLWNGLVVPAGTPPSTVEKLHAEIATILRHSETRERILALGFDPVASTPTQFRQFIRDDVVRSAKVVKDAGIRIE